MPMNNRLLVPQKLPLLLDYAPGAAAAYSLRQLSNSYTGPVVTVRRSTDNGERDFTADEVSDNTLAAWCSGGDGFVKVWHDQSGNERDATAAGAAQPQIVASGVVVTEGGKPAMQFDGGDTLSITAPPSVGQSASGRFFFATAFAVDNLVSSRYVFQASESVALNGSGNTDYGLLLSSTGDAFFATGTSSDAGAWWNLGASPLEQCIFTGSLIASTASAGSKHASVNGVAISTSYAAKAPACTVARIGSRTDGALGFLGTISELIIYISDMTALRTRIEGDMAFYF